MIVLNTAHLQRLLLTGRTGESVFWRSDVEVSRGLLSV